MAEIRNFVIPARLYRYRSLGANLDRELDAITQGYLFCSTYLELNDPMEGHFTSSKMLRKSETYREIRATISDTKAAIGICSFSEVFDHELMWAYYADDFTGICIAYSLSRLKATLGSDIDFARMYYDDKPPTIHRTKKNSKLLAKRVLSHKNQRWLYEREWRMFGTKGKNFYRDISCVTRVYLGSRMSKDDRSRITATLNQLKIKTSEMNVEKYSIRFKAASHS